MTPWGVGLHPLGYGWWLCPHPYPQDYHHLGLEHYEGLGIILVYCWPQVTTTSHAQAHPPRSAVVQNGCGFQLNYKSMVINPSSFFGLTF